MKPILFNTEMVRAILDGRKTVTRLVVKHNPCECESKQLNGVCKLCDDKGGFFWPDEYVKARSPYRPGQTLYVRETFSDELGKYVYRADGAKLHDGMCWHPSIHMPREAARIFLRVTDVQVERLQDITDEQVQKEGCSFTISQAPYKAFEYLWDSTIKPTDRACYGWAANPWVWVVAFERISKGEALRCP